MKTKHDNPKPWDALSSPKSEVYSKIILPQETRSMLNKQYDFTARERTNKT